MGAAVWGSGTFMYVVLQFATAAILTLAANTAYADFPRLSSIIARDGYLPRQLANRGDRLVFSNGVLVLAGAAGGADHRVRRSHERPDPAVRGGRVPLVHLVPGRHGPPPPEGAGAGFKRNIVINAVGAVATGIVLLIVGGTKFTSGAWVPLVVIPLIVLLFKSIKRHYTTVAEGLRVSPGFKPRRMNHTVVVLVGSVHRGVLEALAYARSLAPNHLVAVHVSSDEEDQAHIEEVWEEFGIDIPLEIVYSPYRELTRPVLRYIDELDARYENDVVTVLLPEFVVSHWWGNLLHGQSALLLKGRLLFRKGTVVTSLPYHLE